MKKTGIYTENLPIRSYELRGRLLPDLKQAIDELWADFGISIDEEFNIDTLFGRSAPRFMEVGFGRGEALLEMAMANPENDYVGVDVFLPGVGQLLMRLHEAKVANVRVASCDILKFLPYLPQNCFKGVYLFFPDPWSKRRHHKRRLVREKFVEEVRRILVPGGFFHSATDWDDYALHILNIMEKTGGFVNMAGKGNFSPRPDHRPLTKFERRGENKGHKIRDLLYERIC